MKKTTAMVLSFVLAVTIPVQQSIPVLAATSSIERETDSSIDIAIKQNADVPTSGTCGENLTWEYDEENKTLTISGTGSMPHVNGGHPWRRHDLELETIIIQDGITSIAEMAFEGCKEKSIIIPDSVTEIEKSAFSSNRNLKDITIPDGVTKIEAYVFNSCSGLTSITIPDSVTEIDERAFYGCSSLTKISIPDAVTTIGREAFYGCSGLKDIPDISNVTKLETSIFCGCNGFTTVSIPDCVTEIGPSAFNGCGSLSRLTIPEGVVSIDNNAFANCENLISVNIPGSVRSFGTGIFENCKKLDTVVIQDGITQIWGGAFKDCVRLKNITIPESVTAIGGEAFSGCSRLEHVLIPESVYEIGSKAFCNCISLTSIIIPESITLIANGVFSGCEKLKNIEIPKNVTTIGNYAFKDCVNLKNISLPKGLLFIHSSAFSGCENLAEIVIPESVCSIEGWAFNMCTNLKEFEIPSSQTALSNGMFSGCSNLKKVTIPDSVTEICSRVFEDCSSLQEIKIPNDVKKISIGAFSGCSSLKTIALPPGISVIEKISFRNCSGLEEIEIPDNVTTIEDSAFSGCTKLKYVILPIHVETIGDYVFNDCDDTLLFYRGTEDEWNDTLIKTSKLNGNTLTYLNGNNLVWLDPGTNATIAGNPYVIPDKGVYGDLPTPSKKDFKFLGWYTSIEGGKKITEETALVSKKDHTLYAHWEEDQGVTTVTGISLNQQELKLTVNETKRLSAFIEPSNATNQNISWMSSNKDIAVVDQNGGVTGKKSGEVVITVTTEDGGYQASCDVTVSNGAEEIIPVESVVLNKTEAELKVNEQFLLVASVFPESATDKSISWWCSRPEIVKVDLDGNVTALSEGEATVYAVTGDGRRLASCIITVKNHPEKTKYSVVFYNGKEEIKRESVFSGDVVSSVPDVNGTGIFVGWYTEKNSLWDSTMPILSDLALRARFVSGEGENEEIHSGMNSNLVIQNEKDFYMVRGQSTVLDSSLIWTSEDPKVASVSGKYKITANNVGETTLSDSESKVVYNVIVSQPTIQKDGSTVKKADIVIGDAIQLSIGGLGKYDRNEKKWEYESNYAVSWQSSNNEIAKVDNGLVYGISKGSAKITAYIGGKSFTCTVAVKDNYSVPQYSGSIELIPLQTVTVKYKDGFKVSNAVWTSNQNMNVFYKKNNKVDYYQDGVVRITPTGKLTAVGVGTTELTATNNNSSRSFTVTVKKPVQTTIYLNVGKTKTIKYPNVKNSGVKAASWSIDPNGTSATVSEKGVVKGVSAGRSVVTCTYDPYETGGFTYTTVVYTENPSIVVGDGMIKKDKTAITKNAELSLKAGDTFVIQMTGTDRPMLFTSSKGNIAFADEAGVISAQGKGTANLSAKINGVRYSIKVHVSE